MVKIRLLHRDSNFVLVVSSRQKTKPVLGIHSRIRVIVTLVNWLLFKDELITPSSQVYINFVDITERISYTTPNRVETLLDYCNFNKFQLSLFLFITNQQWGFYALLSLCLPLFLDYVESSTESKSTFKMV